MTVVGIGLFVALSIRAVHQITDRQYTDGKQRAVPAAALIPAATLSSAATHTDTARYETGLATQATSTSGEETLSYNAPPFTPPKDTKQPNLNITRPAQTRTVPSTAGLSGSVLGN